ncbi:unnamed protein product [Leptidea sinapis]|uniref:Uncharacterized protein n=1 Tax=Leptidea sinapis TaxID=189913 RepID=A0A5E4R3C7_9NEOP|nr:unnamed protein product [Leptidea sinapis]
MRIKYNGYYCKFDEDDTEKNIDVLIYKATNTIRGQIHYGFLCLKIPAIELGDIYLNGYTVLAGSCEINSNQEDSPTTITNSIGTLHDIRRDKADVSRRFCCKNGTSNGDNDNCNKFLEIFYRHGYH